jgi:hypothetical protein
MPVVQANGIDVYYEVQGEGEPLVLIPYLPDPDHVRPARPGDLHPFRGPLTQGIADTELVVFEDCAHTPIYENAAEFNELTLGFLHRRSG